MNTHEHLLVCLAEECAEVAQRASKALRFGIDDVQAGQPLTNKARLGEELADLEAVIQMVRAMGLIPDAPSVRRIEAKQQRVGDYMRYARGVGALSDQGTRPSPPRSHQAQLMTQISDGVDGDMRG